MSINKHYRDMAPYASSSGSSRNAAQFIPPHDQPGKMPTVRHTTKMLMIDSRDRDRRNDNANGPFSFTIYLDDPNRKSVGISAYELVHSVELKAFNMPKVDKESYVVVDIDQLAGQIDSTDDGSDGKFTVAFFDGIDSVAGSGMKPGDIKCIKGNDVYTRKVAFDPPISKLNRLTVHIRKHGGDIVKPTDCGGVDYCSMLLEVDMQSRSVH